jgi:hypothetical protein
MAQQPQIRTIWKRVALTLVASLSLGLAGCSLNGFNNPVPSEDQIGNASKGPAIKGMGYGGQNAIIGGKVYLYAAGNSAAAHTYGTGATSLLTSAVLTNNTSTTDAATNTGIGGKDSNNNYYVSTDATGFFSISSDYSCPAAVNGYPVELYIVLLGGNAGGGANSNIALMAALGPCASGTTLATSIPFVVVNELTTVAAVWALQQFMAPPSTTQGSVNIGAPTTNLVGLQNAFSTAANLVDITQGAAPATIGTATPESDKILLLGNILAHCVNSTSIAGDCSNLYASVTPASATLSTKSVAASTLNAPLDTIAAAWYLAQFPNSVGGASCGTSGGAYQCSSGLAAAFNTTITQEPNDWTLAVGYAPTYPVATVATAAISQPYWVALDFYGNAWLTNTGTNSVTMLSPGGAVVTQPVTSYTVGANSGYAATLVSSSAITSATSYSRTISHPREIAIDSSGNAWMADSNGASATSGETAISGGTFVCPTTTGETCDFGTVAEFPAATAAGTAGTGSINGFYTPSFPYAVKADASGNVYFTLAGGSTTYGSKIVGKFNTSGAYTTGGGIGVNPYDIALDNNTAATNGPDVWVADQASGTTGSGSPLAGECGAALVFATGALATNTTYTGLTGGTNATGGCGGTIRDFMTAYTGVFTGIAIDGSNNLWLVNSAYEMGGNTSVASGGAPNTMTYAIVSLTSGKEDVLLNTTSPTSTSSLTTTNPASVTTMGSGGLQDPQYVAVDGAGNAWVSNYYNSAVSEFSVNAKTTSTFTTINTLSGTKGFQHNETGSALSQSEGIGIDLSGNVWVANDASGVGYVTVIVGAAVPVAPPIPGKLGVAP